MAPRNLPNRYDGTCVVCRCSVPAGAGFVHRTRPGDPWEVTCTGCTNPTSAHTTAPPPPNGSAAGAAGPNGAAKASKPHEAGPSKSGDLNRLIKLMKMTTSATDGEALAAMRKANEWLSRAGADWESLILGKVSVMADPFAEIAAPPTPRAEAPYPKNAPPLRPAPPPPRPHTAAPPPNPSKPHNPRAARRPTAAPRTFASDITSTTPLRQRPVPSATDL